MSWIIWFVNGESEVTPPQVDRLKISNDGKYLFAESTRNYEPNVRVATYVMANVLKWSKDA